MKITGTIRNARRVVDDSHRSPYLIGNVYGDTKGRLLDGARIATSTITSEEGDVFRTMYSVYRVESWTETVPA